MTTIIGQIVGVMFGALIGKMIWTGWETFRDRFFTRDKETQEKLKRLKEMKSELKKLKKYYKSCYKKLNKLPVSVIQTDYLLTFMTIEKGISIPTKEDLIRLECSGRILIKKMKLSSSITPRDLYQIIVKEQEEK